MSEPGEHVPVMHTPMSPHGVAFSGAFAQPVAGSQVSAVHGLPSSQLTVVPPQTPAAHLSGLVHSEPSSQDNALFVVLQPSAKSQ